MKMKILDICVDDEQKEWEDLKKSVDQKVKEKQKHACSQAHIHMDFKLA